MQVENRPGMTEITGVRFTEMQETGDKGCVPIVAVNYIREPLQMLHELQGSVVKEGKSNVVINPVFPGNGISIQTDPVVQLLDFKKIYLHFGTGNEARFDRAAIISVTQVDVQ